MRNAKLGEFICSGQRWATAGSCSPWNISCAKWIWWVQLNYCEIGLALVGSRLNFPREKVVRTGSTERNKLFI